MERIKSLFNTPIPEDIGEIHIDWDFPEMIAEGRNKRWYIIMLILLAGCVGIGIYTANYLFVVILVLSLLIFIFQYFEKPRQVPVIIGEDGIVVDQKFYPYKLLRNFWIIYDPPVSKYLYLGFKNDWKRNFSIPLDNANPIEVRAALLNYLDEDLNKEDEELDEVVARFFKMR